MLVILFFIIIVLLSLIYWIGKHNERYWEKRGVTFHKKNKVMGVFWDFLTTDRSLFENWHDIYKQYPNDHVVGIGSFLTPALYIRDPKNIQYVTTTNFKAFNHRGLEPNEDDLLASNLLFLSGKKAQLVRQSMTPLFTSSKLKSMFYIIDKSAQDFVRYLKDNPKLTKSDTFNNLTIFCNTAIGAAVFGVTTNSAFDSPFLKVTQNAFKPDFMRNIKFTIGGLSLTLLKLFNIKFFKDFETFFISAIKQVIRQRERENVKKHDFADICVSLQRKGMLKDLETGFELEPTDELLAAQAFFLFVAGVEPTAFLMFTVLIELGRHPDMLKRLHDEIDKIFEKCDGELTYDTVVGINYLDMIMCEALRLYPPIGFIMKLCTEDTILPNGNVKVDKGTRIYTPVYELHHDPKYHPDPEVFKPERFSKENYKKILDITYQPFGTGNRICLGMKYGQLQAKTGLVHLLKNFTFKTNISKGGIKYKKDQMQVRLANVDVEIVPRI